MCVTSLWPSRGVMAGLAGPLTKERHSVVRSSWTSPQQKFFSDLQIVAGAWQLQVCWSPVGTITNDPKILSWRQHSWAISQFCGQVQQPPRAHFLGLTAESRCQLGCVFPRSLNRERLCPA